MDDDIEEIQGLPRGARVAIDGTRTYAVFIAKLIENLKHSWKPDSRRM